ncbi:MAG: head GIN domain-containing protein [Saprospiraceae bacterium]|nr:head GIN domain-containing protein [Saprospiraceae bacterium]
MKTIKKMFILFISATALMYTPGCFVDLDDDDDFFGCVDADGAIVNEVINMASFDAIDLRIAGKVYIRQGNQQRVEIEAPQRLIDEMEFDVRGGEWEIKTDRCVRYDNDDLIIYITLPKISSLKISGSGDIISENTLEVEDLDLRISGSGSIDAAIEADDIDATISGSGDIYLEGRADVLNFVISGSGDFRGFNLLVNAAKITISGSGDVEVSVVDALDVKIFGSGDVYYKGTPTINTQISGSGKVINAN